MVENTLFYKDNYMKEFVSKVVKIEEAKGGKYKVVLDNTAFYPEGGGQPADVGFLNDAVVSFVEESNGEIFHTIDKYIEIGTKVHGKIDFEKRFSNMQSHTAEHIVSGIICKKYDATNVGFHIGKDFITIDFNKAINHKDIVEIEKAANEAVYKDIGIITRIYTNEEIKNLEYRSKKELKEDVRIVEVPGYDRCACCGIHVARTGEIGIIKLLRIENYKGGVRIYMIAGSKALEDYNDKYSQINKISTLLSVKLEDVYDEVKKLKEEYDKSKVKEKSLKLELLKKQIEKIKKDNIILEVDDLTGNEMKTFCEFILKEKKVNIAGIISSNKFILMSDKEDLKKKLDEIKEKLDIKGGGNSSLIQGQFSCDTNKFIKLI